MRQDKITPERNGIFETGRYKQRGPDISIDGRIVAVVLSTERAQA